MLDADAMAMMVSIDHGERRVTLVGTTPLTPSDIDAGIDARANESGAWQYATVIDFRAVGTWLPTSELVQRYAQRMGALDMTHGARGPVAFVVTRDQPALYGMLRMYAFHAESNHGGRVGVFYSHADADAWLKDT